MKTEHRNFIIEARKRYPQFPYYILLRVAKCENPWEVLMLTGIPHIPTRKRMQRKIRRVLGSRGYRFNANGHYLGPPMKVRKEYECVKYIGNSIPGLCTCRGMAPHVHLIEHGISVLKINDHVIYEQINPYAIIKEVLTQKEVNEQYVTGV